MKRPRRIRLLIRTYHADLFCGAVALLVLAWLAAAALGLNLGWPA